MKETEFDAFADEYQLQHKCSIRASGESPEFFHEYKVADVAAIVGPAGTASCLRILDFGCGVGNSLPYFRRHFPHSRLTGLDVSQRSLSIAQRRYPGVADLVRFDGGEKRIPFAPNTFDIVFAACVFHHIDGERHLPYFLEWQRILKPGGMVVVFEHNPYNPLTLRAVANCPFDDNAVLIRPTRLTSLLKQAGLRDARCCYRIFFPRALRRLRPLEPYFAWLPLGAQYRVSARRL